jgi:hypothetical protein
MRRRRRHKHTARSNSQPLLGAGSAAVTVRSLPQKRSQLRRAISRQWRLRYSRKM